MTPREEFVAAMQPLTKGAMPMEQLYLRKLAVAFAENTHQPANCCGMACAEKRFPVRRFLRECGLEDTP